MDFKIVDAIIRSWGGGGALPPKELSKFNPIYCHLMHSVALLITFPKAHLGKSGMFFKEI